uniref:phage tail tube protein n=1 Tax=uncultured Caulobacter sp. TaxID=158749 RepID=UPI0025E68B90|nr:phage tail tube protein [uncultured Caulobacter sp.]
MAVAQGINKKTVYKKQTGLGAAATGTGGQIVRRTSSVFQAPPDTFESNEIVSHQQSTGVGLGVVKPAGKIDGLLSPGSYAALLGSLLRKDMTAGASATGATISVAASGQNWTLTRAAGSYLTDGFKIGDVVRLTAGAFNVLNTQKNLLVIALTATVATVRVINGSPMFAETNIASATVAVSGKKSLVPLTAHTNDYYTFEEWYPDLGRSETYADQQVGQAALNLPATGNATISLDTVGRTRTLGAAQVLTSPNPETGTDILTAVNGVILVNGAPVANVTGAQVTINGNAAHSDAVVGSNVVDDIQRGRIAVSGSFTAKFDSVSLQSIFDGRSTTSLVLAITEDATANADFVVISLPMIKLTGDTPDDGEKAVIRTYPFTAQINSAGGAALATDQTIVAIQDSAA